MTGPDPSGIVCITFKTIKIMRTTYQLTTVPASGIICIRESVILRVMFDIEHREPVTIDGETGRDDLYDLTIVDVSGTSYGEIVSAIINDRYPSDQVQALTANRALALDEDSDITDDKRHEYLDEYAAYQAYRSHAKEIASLAIIELNA